ncbi:hypothetical protein [Flavobacterium piscis]|uniref:hypothetical protein n=1 Tax=Flavobacterium piscis TaxID=1114874 RepID=UPI0013F4E90C|nr:hypothetical protein [Flavobacterium piscis]
MEFVVNAKVSFINNLLPWNIYVLNAQVHCTDIQIASMSLQMSDAKNVIGTAIQVIISIN